MISLDFVIYLGGILILDMLAYLVTLMLSLVNYFLVENGVSRVIDDFWRGHTFRLMKMHFDGTIEERDAPKLLSGLDILK